MSAIEICAATNHDWVFVLKYSAAAVDGPEEVVMSYSDYGGFAWKNGERFKEAEDATLIGIRAPDERPLEAATGMKLDVLANAYAAQGESYGSEGAHEKIDWLTGHPHHVVLGGMDGIGIVGHKQWISVTLSGKEIAKFPDNVVEGYEEPPDGAEYRLERDGYTVVARYTKYPHSSGVMVYFRTPDGARYTAIVGYGVGDHWWRDEEGREYLRTGERAEVFEDEVMWVWRSDLDEEDAKKHGVGQGEVIGFKDQAPWPTYEWWKKHVADWARGIVGAAG